jgi:hypothetical protein
VRGLDRRLARLEAKRAAGDKALVAPETLMRMAAVYEAECARVRERLLGDGPHVPVPAMSDAGNGALPDEPCDVVYRIASWEESEWNGAWAGPGRQRT